MNIVDILIGTVPQHIKIAIRKENHKQYMRRRRAEDPAYARKLLDQENKRYREDEAHRQRKLEYNREYRKKLSDERKRATVARRKEILASLPLEEYERRHQQHLRHARESRARAKQRLVDAYLDSPVWCAVIGSLRSGPSSVEELVESLGVDEGTVREVLRALTGAGIVRRRPRHNGPRIAGTQYVLVEANHGKGKKGEAEPSA